MHSTQTHNVYTVHVRKAGSVCTFIIGFHQIISYDLGTGIALHYFAP